MKKRCLFAATTLLCAQSTFAFDSDSLEIVVTASRTAVTADDVHASVTVINRDDIERQQAQSVQSLLQGVTGINLTNNGGQGKATSVFLRGTESDHVLVLIDGIKVGSATLGRTAFQNLPIEQIERIEIVRGPLSSLYGSEAVGGVIQIFTRKGGGETKPFFSIGGGSYNTYNASLGVSGGGDRGWYSVSASGIDTKGFNACDGKPSPGGAGCYTIEPDKDGYNNLSGSIRVGYQFEHGLEVDAYALQSEGETEFDGSSQNESESVQKISGGTIKYSPLDIWQLTLLAGRSRDESDNFKDNTFSSRFKTERDTLSFQNDFSITDNSLLTFGIDYQDDKVSGSTSYTVTSRDNKGVFAQYLSTVGNQDIQLSLREDDNEQFGNHSTGSAAWAYKLNNDLRFNVSYGSAFKAPTFNELYYPGYGNASLQPEESRSIELGISGKTDYGHWSSNVFETRIDDLIAYDASIFAPGNVDEARIRGLEVVLGAKIKTWDFTTNLTLLDPENRSSGSSNGNVLARRAEQSMRVDANHKMGKYTFGTTVLAEGRRYDDLANTRELSGYTTIDLRAEYAFAKNWLLQARVENLLDKDYETAAFFNQPGRGLYMTLRYQP